MGRVTETRFLVQHTNPLSVSVDWMKTEMV